MGKVKLLYVDIVIHLQLPSLATVFILKKNQRVQRRGTKDAFDIICSLNQAVITLEVEQQKYP